MIKEGVAFIDCVNNIGVSRDRNARWSALAEFGTSTHIQALFNEYSNAPLARR